MANGAENALNLKKRIRSGAKVAGVMVESNIDRAGLETVLSKRSYDFVWTDTHSYAFNQDRLLEFCTTAQELDVPAMVRIEHSHDAYLIGKYLDLGASGIMIPQIENESTVEEALLRFYYPPVGGARLGWVGKGGTG